jgi:hypothetical protein
MDAKAQALVVETSMTEAHARQEVARLAALPGGADAIAGEWRHRLDLMGRVNAARERRARRALAREGLTVRKSRRARTGGAVYVNGIYQGQNIDDYGGFMIVDANGNFVVAGARFDLTLEHLEEYVAGLPD